ncbi:hypothetical protein VTO42DRAFT_8743 [Malbranchea cinnamomea]
MPRIGFRLPSRFPFQTNLAEPVVTPVSAIVAQDSATTPVDPPQPTPYEFSQRIKALFQDPPKKSIIRRWESFPIKYREGSWTKFKRNVTQTVETYWIKLSPKVQSAAHRVHKTPVTKIIKCHARRCAKVVARKARLTRKKLKKFAKRLEDKTPLAQKWQERRQRNYNHGINYDEFVEFIDMQLAESRQRRAQRAAQHEAECLERERLQCLSHNTGTITSVKVPILETGSLANCDQDLDAYDEIYRVW